MIWRKGGSLFFFFFLEGAHDGQWKIWTWALGWTGLDSGLDWTFF